jgi:hypothetical protein
LSRADLMNTRTCATVGLAGLSNSTRAASGTLRWCVRSPLVRSRPTLASTFGALGSLRPCSRTHPEHVGHERVLPGGLDGAPPHPRWRPKRGPARPARTGLLRCRSRSARRSGSPLAAQNRRARVRCATRGFWRTGRARSTGVVVRNPDALEHAPESRTFPITPLPATTWFSAPGMCRVLAAAMRWSISTTALSPHRQSESGAGWRSTTQPASWCTDDHRRSGAGASGQYIGPNGANRTPSGASPKTLHASTGAGWVISNGRPRAQAGLGAGVRGRARHLRSVLSRERTVTLTPGAKPEENI